MSESTKRIIIGEAVAGAAWLIVMLVSESIFTNLAVFGISIMFGVLACVASVLSLLFNDRELRSAGVMTEVRSLPVVVSVGYFAAALIAKGPRTKSRTSGGSRKESGCTRGRSARGSSGSSTGAA